MSNSFHINSATIPYCAMETMYSPNVLTASYMFISAETSSFVALPFTLLHLNGKNDSPARMLLDTANSINGFGSSIRGRRTRGSVNSALAVLENDVLLQVVAEGYDGTDFSSAAIGHTMLAAENWTTSSHASYHTFQTTAQNSTTSREVLRITSEGITQGQFSGSLIGTSSYSISASWAPNTNDTISASYSQTASYVIPSISSVLVNSNVTGVLFQYPNTIHNSIFLKYMLNDSVNYRAGNVVVIYTTSSAKMTETCTADIGDTTPIVLNTDISASTVRIFAINNSPTDFNIKCQFDIL